MTLFDDILTQFPPDVQETVRNIWEALGPNEKAGFLSLSRFTKQMEQRWCSSLCSKRARLCWNPMSKPTFQIQSL